jgi:hypothetical protein
MHFDFTINVPIIATMLASAVGVIFKLGALQRVLKEYPLHRHIDDAAVLYPKDMRPEPTSHSKASI